MSGGTQEWTAPSPDAAPVSLNMRRFEPPALPFVTPEIIRKAIEEGERPVRQWLDRNRKRANLLSIEALIVEIAKQAPGAAQKGVGELRYIIEDWARKNAVNLPPVSTPPHPADQPTKWANPSDSELVKAVKDVVKTAKNGVSVQAGPLITKVSVSGATAQLGPFGVGVTPSGDVSGTLAVGKGKTKGKVTVDTDGVSAEVEKGDFKLKHSVNWAGEMKLDTSYEKFRLVGKLSGKSWSLTLTFNTKDMPPYPGAIAEIFTKGEEGVRGIVNETRSFESLSDIPDIKQRIDPHLKPVKKAVGTAGILAGLKSRVSFGAQISGPGVNAGQAELQRGVNAMLVLTVRF